MCIAIGCDYLENVKGIGFTTVINSFTAKKPLDTFKKALLKKGLSAQDVKEYFEQMEKVLLGFKHQIVYDPKT